MLISRSNLKIIQSILKQLEQGLSVIKGSKKLIQLKNYYFNKILHSVLFKIKKRSKL